MVYLIETRMRLRKFKPRFFKPSSKYQYPPGQAGPQASSNAAGDRVGLSASHHHFGVSVCRRFPRDAISTAAKRYHLHAHDSLQMPVKYEDGVFQTHRQIQALV
jgi:hypothetical protein